MLISISVRKKTAKGHDEVRFLRVDLVKLMSIGAAITSGNVSVNAGRNIDRDFWSFSLIHCVDLQKTRISHIFE